MAIVVIAASIPANTTTPLMVEVPVFKRYVDWCTVRFPDNAAYLVGVALFNADQRFAPAPGSNYQYIRDDGETVRWREQLDLGGSPRVVRLYAVNEDTKYTREVEARLEVLDFPTWQSVYQVRAG